MVTGRVGGEALLQRFQPDGSVDRRFRSGRPTLPPSGAYLGDEGNVLSAAAGGGFFLGTGSSAGGDVYRFRHNGSLQAGFSQDGVAHVEGLSRILDLAPAKGGSNYVLGISYGACSLESAASGPRGRLTPALEAVAGAGLPTAPAPHLPRHRPGAAPRRRRRRRR